MQGSLFGRRATVSDIHSTLMYEIKFHPTLKPVRQKWIITYIGISGVRKITGYLQKGMGGPMMKGGCTLIKDLWLLTIIGQ